MASNHKYFVEKGKGLCKEETEGPTLPMTPSSASSSSVMDFDHP